MTTAHFDYTAAAQLPFIGTWACLIKTNHHELLYGGVLLGPNVSELGAARATEQLCLHLNLNATLITDDLNLARRHLTHLPLRRLERDAPEQQRVHTLARTLYRQALNLNIQQLADLERTFPPTNLRPAQQPLTLTTLPWRLEGDMAFIQFQDTWHAIGRKDRQIDAMSVRLAELSGLPPGILHAALTETRRVIQAAKKDAALRAAPPPPPPLIPSNPDKRPTTLQERQRITTQLNLTTTWKVQRTQQLQKWTLQSEMRRTPEHRVAWTVVVSQLPSPNRYPMPTTTKGISSLTAQLSTRMGLPQPAVQSALELLCLSDIHAVRGQTRPPIPAVQNPKGARN